MSNTTSKAPQPRRLDASFILASVKRALLGEAPPKLRVDRFELLQRLGQGASGVVYHARDVRRGEEVALKCLQWVGKGEHERIAHEFRVASELVHPNLVHLYELGCSEHHEFYLTMARIDGGDLLTALRQAADASNYAALRTLLRQLASGLTYLHANGRAHGDIKPANVLVDRGGRVVILDFGLTTSQERQGVAGGTPPFVPPEWSPRASATKAGDCYAVGVLLYLALNPSALSSMDNGEIAPRALLNTDIQLPEGVPSDVLECCRQLLLSDPEQRWSARDLHAHLGGGAHPPEITRPVAALVGRDHELKELMTATQQARAHGEAVLVQGDAGIGKSRLLAHAIERLRSEGWLVFRGACRENENFPYCALDGVLLDVAAHLAELAPEVRSSLLAGARPLATFFPNLAACAGLKPEPITRELRAQAREALAVLLLRLGRRRPIAIIWDDCQWADADSLELLPILFGFSGAPGVLLLAASQNSSGTSGLEDGLVGVFERCRHTTLLALGPLPRNAALQLGREALPNVDPWRLSGVIEQSAGNPRLLLDVAAALTGPESAATASLKALLARKIAVLSPQARALLEVLSVASGPLECDAAFRAADVEKRALETAWELRAARLIMTDGDFDQGQLNLRYPQISSVVLEEMASAARRRHDENLARAIEHSFPRAHDRVALHYAKAGLREAAAHHAYVAAEQAVEHGNVARAAHFYLLASKNEDSAPLRKEALFHRAELLSRWGHQRQAAQARVELAEVAESVPERLIERCRAGYHFLRAGDRGAGMSHLEAVAAELGWELESPLVAALLGSWQSLRFQPQFGTEAQPFAEDSELRCRLHVARWCAAAMVDSAAPAARIWARRYQGLAARSGDPRVALRAALEASVEPWAIDGVVTPRALELLARAEDCARSLQHPATLAWVDAAWAAMALRQARSVSALGHASSAAQALEHSAETSSEYVAARLLELDCLLFSGRHTEFARACDALALMVEQGADVRLLARFQYYALFRALFSGDALGALSALQHLNRARDAVDPLERARVEIAQLAQALFAEKSPRPPTEQDELRQRLTRLPARTRTELLTWHARGALAAWRSTGEGWARDQVLRHAAELDDVPFPTARGQAALLRACMAQHAHQQATALAQLELALGNFEHAGALLETNLTRAALVELGTRGGELGTRAAEYFRTQRYSGQLPIMKALLPGFVHV